MLTMQTAQGHAIAGASETAGLLVFQPRERPPTQLHQAPSRLQRCAPSRLSTISGAADPSLSPPASSSLDRPQYPLSEPADHLRQAGASFRTRGGEARASAKIAPHLQVIARSHVFAPTSPRPKLPQRRYSCFALVLYQPKFPETIHGLSAVV